MSNVAICLAAEAHFHIWQRYIVPLIFNYRPQIQRFQYQTQGTTRHAPDPIHRISHLLASVSIPMLVRKTETRQTEVDENLRDRLALMYRVHEIPGSNKNLHACQWFVVILSCSSTV